MTVSAVPTFIDALVSTLTTAFPSTTLVAGLPVQVFDGVGLTSQDTGRQVWVGISDPFSDDAAPESATATQEWPYASHAFRREVITVHLVAQSWSGNDTPKAMRDAAYAIVNAVVAAIVVDPSLGGALMDITEPISSMTLRQVQDDKGVLAQVAFDVTGRQQFQN